MFPCLYRRLWLKSSVFRGWNLFSEWLRVFAHPHAEDKEPNLLHQGVLSDLLFPFFLRGIWIVAPLAQFHVHDAWFDKASGHILQLQVQVWHSKTRYWLSINDKSWGLLSDNDLANLLIVILFNFLFKLTSLLQPISVVPVFKHVLFTLKAQFGVRSLTFGAVRRRPCAVILGQVVLELQKTWIRAVLCINLEHKPTVPAARQIK